MRLFLPCVDIKALTANATGRPGVGGYDKDGAVGARGKLLHGAGREGMMMQLLGNEQIYCATVYLREQHTVLMLTAEETQQHRSSDQQGGNGKHDQCKQGKEQCCRACAQKGKDGRKDGNNARDQSISAKIDPKVERALINPALPKAMP